jgi:hypothetical protein
MSISSKGSVDVNPYPNLSKSLDSSIVLISEEIEALRGTADCPTVGARPSARVATHYGALWWTLDHPTSRVGLSMRGVARCSPLCWTSDRPTSGARPSVGVSVDYSPLC